MLTTTKNGKLESLLGFAQEWDTNQDKKKQTSVKKTERTGPVLSEIRRKSNVKSQDYDHKAADASRFLVKLKTVLASQQKSYSC